MQRLFSPRSESLGDRFQNFFIFYIITYNEMFDKMEKIKYNRKSDRDGQPRVGGERLPYEESPGSTGQE